MYTHHFQLSKQPFSLTPDPAFLFLSERHREALAHLLYGLGERGGFVQLTGEVGTGKTTLCRCVLEQAPAEVDVALILNPRQSPEELLASICDEFGVDYPAATPSVKVLVDRLNAYLLDAHARGRRAVLVLDEAQNLSTEVLEQVRLLTNLETATDKLLQILLIGQPELRRVMARPELRQLAQRITARYHLTPLTRHETVQYVRHRLAVAGCDRPLFSPAALRTVHRLSGGIPRLINVLCDRALLGGYALHRQRIGAATVRRAATEVLGGSTSRPAWIWAFGLAALLAAAVVTARLVPWPLLREWATPAEADVEARIRVEEPPLTPPTVTPAQAEPEPQGAVPDPGSDALSNPTELLAAATELDGALIRLLELWGVDSPVPQTAEACVLAARSGLRCFSGSGSWAALQHHDRPVALGLRVPGASQRWLAVSRIDGPRVQIETSAGPRRTTREDLDPLWFGDYQLLWKSPPGGLALLGPGSQGDVVRWLRDLLRRAGAAAPDGGDQAALYGEDLESAVRAFQVEHGLRPDGMAGRETLMRARTLAAEPTVPLLQAPAGGP